jgi:hypothetical protein
MEEQHGLLPEGVENCVYSGPKPNPELRVQPDIPPMFLVPTF